MLYIYIYNIITVFKINLNKIIDLLPMTENQYLLGIKIKNIK